MSLSLFSEGAALVCGNIYSAIPGHGFASMLLKCAWTLFDVRGHSHFIARSVLGAGCNLGPVHGSLPLGIDGFYERYLTPLLGYEMDKAARSEIDLVRDVTVEAPLKGWRAMARCCARLKDGRLARRIAFDETAEGFDQVIFPDEDGTRSMLEDRCGVLSPCRTDIGWRDRDYGDVLAAFTAS